MIQEKDFLYRVPVKNVLVTTPGKQVRNPEILIDLEGGEFMHGNILDANSTNKLIDQSVKDAIDNSIENDNYVTRDLLEAETSARTKSDEDLNAKIKAEQTRAEGKEKEISDKLAIVNGDLHTALNQAITEKADASALTNEVNRAIGVENDLKTAIGKKADASALSNYVLTTALPTIPTKVSQLTNDSNFITAADVDFTPYATRDFVTTGLAAKQDKIDPRTVVTINLQTANLEQLRDIVSNLISALDSSHLIKTRS